MNFIIFATFIIFTSILSMTIKRHNRSEKNQQEQFWEREKRANQVRRKPLDDLDYVTIPLENLPTAVLAEDVIVQDCLNTLVSLSREKIVNLAGYTNTDLKPMARPISQPCPSMTKTLPCWPRHCRNGPIRCTMPDTWRRHGRSWNTPFYP